MLLFCVFCKATGNLDFDEPSGPVCYKVLVLRTAKFSENVDNPRGWRGIAVLEIEMEIKSRIKNKPVIRNYKKEHKRCLKTYCKTLR
jgi:hypothetical protein